MLLDQIRALALVKRHIYGLQEAFGGNLDAAH
ncbi:carboxylesterase family protein [Aeromonas veronii]|nr:carboxylesterase family protein [Aeromonas veronii]MCF5866477.1 carboxylesterase family protein [Aeromonas veronii]MCZ4263005.1 carboxylesterase family protein [Limimaricola sp. G21655-S1]